MKSSQIHNTELQNDNHISYMQSWHAFKKVEIQIFMIRLNSLRRFLPHWSISLRLIHRPTGD